MSGVLRIFRACGVLHVRLGVNLCAALLIEKISDFRIGNLGSPYLPGLYMILIKHDPHISYKAVPGAFVIAGSIGEGLCPGGSHMFCSLNRC